MENYIRELLKMVDDGDSMEVVGDHLKSLTVDQLIEIIKFSIDNKSLSWKNRMLLQMVNDSPFSFWACDEQFIVKLWEAASTEIYDENFNGKEFWRFVEKKERKKALEDCLYIISKQGGRVKEFDNYYAIEEGDIGIITQSFSLYDDLNDKYLQGEIGLNIRLPEVQQKHDKIIQERQQILNQFVGRCNDLRNEFLQKKNDILQKINDQAEVSRRSLLRQRCNEIYLYFNERIQQILDEAMLDDEDLLRLQNEFYEEFDKLEISINKLDEEISQALSFVDEKTRVERHYQLLFSDTKMLFDTEIEQLSERAKSERKKNKNSQDAMRIDEQRMTVFDTMLDYIKDMEQLEKKLKAAVSLEIVLIIDRQITKRTDEAKKTLGT